MPWVQALTRVPGAPPRADLAARYAAATGRSTEALPWYMALAFWKLAAIVECAYAQYLAGELDSDYARGLGTNVPALLAEAAAFASLRATWLTRIDRRSWNFRQRSAARRRPGRRAGERVAAWTSN